MAFLAPAVAAVLDEAGLSPGGLAGVACVRGPGGFTGIRVGLALAEGLRLGTGAPLWGLDALPLAARRGFFFRPGARRVAVAMHARRGLVYLQTFTAGEGRTPVADGPALVLPAEAAARLAAEALAGCSPSEALVIGSGVRNNRAAFAAVFPEACLAPDEIAFPDAATLAAAATGPFRDAPRPAEAAYLRPSDAEDNLAALARERGLDPEAALARLAAALSSTIP
jgi:tRNA threonylcarbamoyl adenosine modification protein YeaZ